MLAKKSIETGEGCDSIPESMRHYLAMQFDPSKSGSRDSFGRAAGYGAPGMYANEVNPSGKVGMYHKSPVATSRCLLQLATVDRNPLTCKFSYLSLHLPLFDGR